MAASVESGFDQAWLGEPARSDPGDELPTDGAHAWFGIILMIASSVVTIRGLCWVAAHMIRLVQ